MAKNLKSHNFSLIIYENNHNNILNVLNSNTNICYYAFATHDKDVNENGILKDKHTHLLISLKDTRELKTVQNYFKFVVEGKLQNTFVEFVHDKQKAFEYLTHKNDLDKYQYNDNILVYNNYDFWHTDNNTKEDTTINIINDLIKKVPLRVMVCTYGRDFVFHYNQYRELAQIIELQDKQIDFIETDIDSLSLLDK